MEVSAWLREMGLGRYAQAFQDHDITPALLPKLTADDLKELGIGSVGHRRLILSAIALLKEQEEPTPRGKAEPHPDLSDEAERRQLSVVFCDFVGSTALAARLDPEDLRELIGAYQSRVTAVVTQFGGLVAEYLGDGVLVYFGWPRATEWDAEQAVNAGLEIVAAVSSLDAGGRACQMRVGIATGLVVVGGTIAGSGKAQAAMGQAPNLAARLQAAAEPDTVVIDQATHERAGSLFVCEAMPPRQLKGFSTEVRAWRALARNTLQSRFAARNRTSSASPLVGREGELALLLGCWRRAKAGTGQIVLISGEPGIGKSRLVAELEARVAGPPCVLLRYFCSPQRQNSALHPIVSQIEHAAGFELGDTAARRLRRLRDLLSPTAPSEEELTVFADLLSLGTEQLPPLNVNPRRKKEMTFAALNRHLDGLARLRPVLMLVEDLHWSDPTTIEFFGSLMSRLRDRPVLVVATFRPEFRPPWSGAEVTLVTLARLNETHSAQLVTAVASSALFTTEVQDQIVRRADGVPLFIEELTRTVLQREPARHGEARIALPETLQSALMARLDRLPAAKEVAQIGAVLGREFREDLMTAIAPIPPERLRQGLDQLTGSGLAERHVEGTSTVYVFKHALVQDAAYESLLRSRRAAIHGLVAQRLAQSTEVLGGDPEILARHYAGAGLTNQAVVSWLRAAELAMSRWAHLEAIAHLKAALAAIEADARHEVPPPILLDLWLRLADSLLEARGYGLQETADAYQRALEIARTIAAEAPLFAALVGLSNFHLHRGDAETGLQISRELVERAARAGDAAAEAAGHRLVGATYLFRGEFPAARRCFEQALEKYDRPSEGPLLTSHRYNQRVSCRYYLSQTLLPMGLEAEALDYCRDAVEIAGTSAFPSHVALALDGYCSLHQHCREWDDLACQGEALIRLASDKKLPFWLSLGEVSQGLALANRGMADAGIRQIERGVERYQGTNATRALPFLLGSLAAAHEVAGDLALASSVLDKALSTARELGHRAEGELTRLQGELAFLESPPRADLAEDRFRKALGIARAQSAKTFELRAALSLSVLDCRTERTSAAEMLAPLIPTLPPGLLHREVDRMIKHSPLMQSRSSAELSALRARITQLD